MSIDLQAQQDELLRALWLPLHEQAFTAVLASGAVAEDRTWRRGLQAYRSNAQALAQRALAGAYPVIAQLLGEENFGAVARDLWRHAPVQCGDIAQWGGDLAERLGTLSDIAREEPYLGDVARVEWLLHRAATCGDEPQDRESFGLLTQRDPAGCRLRLAPGTACVASGYPVVSIIQAHLGELGLDVAAMRLRANVAQTALVWRDGLRPRIREALEGEPAFIAMLKEGRSLAEALEAASALDFASWLPQAVTSGLVPGVTALH